jgi:histidyl-tRNA synthetase
MTKRVINEVQEYLTICGENRVYQIVNVELLLRRHPPEAVIAFLDQLRMEYKKELGQLIKNNKTDEKINELVAKNFRLKMAITTIKNAKEVQDAA